MKKLILGISIMAIGAVGTISMIVATILSPLNPWSYDGISGWYGCILGMDLLIPFIISIIVAIIGLAIAVSKLYRSLHLTGRKAGLTIYCSTRAATSGITATTEISCHPCLWQNTGLYSRLIRTAGN